MVLTTSFLYFCLTRWLMDFMYPDSGRLSSVVFLSPFSGCSCLQTSLSQLRHLKAVFTMAPFFYSECSAAMRKIIYFILFSKKQIAFWTYDLSDFSIRFSWTIDIFQVSFAFYFCRSSCEHFLEILSSRSLSPHFVQFLSSSMIFSSNFWLQTLLMIVFSSAISCWFFSNFRATMDIFSPLMSSLFCRLRTFSASAFIMLSSKVNFDQLSSFSFYTSLSRDPLGSQVQCLLLAQLPLLNNLDPPWLSVGSYFSKRGQLAIFYFSTFSLLLKALKVQLTLSFLFIFSIISSKSLCLDSYCLLLASISS